ncbi:hypothetical protein N9Y42_03485 [Mariniblastus sp.]|nr:hypothetical protein [Mariniblastus sp.]
MSQPKAAVVERLDYMPTRGKAVPLRNDTIRDPFWSQGESLAKDCWFNRNLASQVSLLLV